MAIDSAIHSFDILVNGTAVTFGIDGAAVATITPTNALPTAYLYTSSMWFAPDDGNGCHRFNYADVRRRKLIPRLDLEEASALRLHSQ